LKPFAVMWLCTADRQGPWHLHKYRLTKVAPIEHACWGVLGKRKLLRNVLFG
jgi:hypothetical protein